MSPASRVARLIELAPLVLVLGLALTAGLVWPPTAASQGAVDAAQPKTPPTWSTVTAELPWSEASFPPGNGAELANGECLICHSAGMVLRQPPLTEEAWRAEVNKMRTVFGAPVPETQVDALAKYLHSVNGAQP